MHSSLGFQEVYSHIGKLHYCTSAVKNSIGALISEIPECKCEKSRNLHIIYLGKHDWNIHARWLHIDKLDRDITYVMCQKQKKIHIPHQDLKKKMKKEYLFQHGFKCALMWKGKTQDLKKKSIWIHICFLNISM